MTHTTMAHADKKGFTLIEMLVVIAIIAILVSIIVPVVGNSTVKAAAATNAANLRSAAASIAVEFLEDKLSVSEDGTLTGYSLDVPEAKAVKAEGIDNSSLDFTAKVVENNIVCAYGANTVELYADIAEDGKKDGGGPCPCTAYTSENNNGPGYNGFYSGDDCTNCTHPANNHSKDWMSGKITCSGTN